MSYLCCSQEGFPPPWMVKSSTGTEEATCPMWVSSSSVRPVDGQVRLLGWPSRLKKPTHTQVLYSSHTHTALCMCVCELLTHSPGQGESSQCLMWRIFSSLERTCASSQILSYLAISSCREGDEGGGRHGERTESCGDHLCSSSVCVL